MSFLDFLKENGAINSDLYTIAASRFDGESYICDVLTSSGEYDEEGIAQLKSEFFVLRYTNLSTFSKIDGLDYATLENSLAIPFRVSNGTVEVAISDPNDLKAKNEVDYALSLCETTKKFKPIYYIGSKSKIKHKFSELNSRKQQCIDQILFEATEKSESDIHITPFEKTFKIMLRIDGELTEYRTLDINDFEKIKISTKVLANLDISENRRPQSGSFQRSNIDFRVSTHPTLFGENIVIRILNKDKSMIAIDKIGFSIEQTEYLKAICSLTNGMIIFCGPTGSGKTTSIYSMIETMDKIGRNIMTLEDPIEYKITNIKQTEIISGVISFADGIKSILRQDPDVILIGEIRDKETAKMAIRASMTGHLVLSSVHAVDSFGAISRFKEFGISDSLIAENLIAVISQRLIKKKNGSGRTAVSEILKINSKLKEQISKGANRAALEKQAYKENFENLYENCRAKVTNGIISKDDAETILLTEHCQLHVHKYGKIHVANEDKKLLTNAKELLTCSQSYQQPVDNFVKNPKSITKEV